MTFAKFRIWTLWLDVCEDTGLTIEAWNAEHALAKAHAQGVGYGLGSHPRYRGLHAQLVIE